MIVPRLQSRRSKVHAVYLVAQMLGIVLLFLAAAFGGLLACFWLLLEWPR